MTTAFLDTNVVVYAVAQPDRRSDRARQILAAGGTISVQTLNEFTHVCRRKLRRSLPEIEAALARIRVVCRPILPITIATHEAALALIGRYGFATYDALIVASALEAGCATLYSEDMHDGLVVDGSLTIRNPFAFQ